MSVYSQIQDTEWRIFNYCCSFRIRIPCNCIKAMTCFWRAQWQMYIFFKPFIAMVILIVSITSEHTLLVCMKSVIKRQELFSNVLKLRFVDILKLSVCQTQWRAFQCVSFHALKWLHIFSILYRNIRHTCMILRVLVERLFPF